MTNDETILELARAVRPYLSELVEEPRAAALDAEFAELLAEAPARGDVDERVLDLLGQSPALGDWAAAFLERGAPPEVAYLEERSRLQGLAGEGEVVRAPRYACPEGDFVFYRRSVGQAVPECPTHHLPLRATAGR